MHSSALQRDLVVLRQQRTKYRCCKDVTCPWRFGHYRIRFTLRYSSVGFETERASEYLRARGEVSDDRDAERGPRYGGSWVVMAREGSKQEVCAGKAVGLRTRLQARLAKQVPWFEIGLVHLAEMTGELHSESPQSHTNGGAAQVSI